VAVASRDADHHVAGPDQRQMGGESGARQPVEDGDVVELLRAPEVLEMGYGVTEERWIVMVRAPP
jgi:hypothetical protein